ncbi:MAG TPA: VWA domain-containing protein [Blastocatellia bacterium]|nr:VWA domain-containing protein [Blastocatellia bacterium]HMY74364.1 VWA domain-containing protein [Blastocatellia bacterium]HMZ16325.1 VWA domain-containing protein [Blastocatellia bacterium]HNG28876.1 VWA domain-containing protein [Blastocatellia bacterium]
MLAVAQSGRKPQQKPGEQQPKPGDAPTVRIETREVVLPLTAYDADGKYIDDLQPKDVLVLEEGEARQVTALKREPANIVLILDLANEIGTFKNAPTERYGKPDTPIWEKGPAYKPIRRPTQSEFAAQFISNLSPNDKLAIIQYAEKPQLIQDWTSDRNQALNALSSKYRVGIRSSYHDALKLAADKLEAQPNGRRIVVLITDGLDSSSKTGKSKAIQALEKARATMFIIGWAEALRREIEIAIGWIANHEVAGTNAQKRIEELRRHVKQLDGAAVELNSLAENSGGELWLPPTHEALILSNRTVSQEIGAQYSLSFVTENTPSLEDKRSIQVLPARPGLSVRSRRSYYISEEPKALTR